MRQHNPRTFATRWMRRLVLVASGVTVFQAASCQTSAQDLFSGFLAAAATNVINSFVFNTFSLTP